MVIEDSEKNRESGAVFCSTIRVSADLIVGMAAAWTEATASISEWVSLTTISPTVGHLAATANAMVARHNRILTDSQSLLVVLEEHKKQALSEMLELAQQAVPTVPPRVYSDRAQDLALLQLTFACRELHTVQTSLASNRMERILIHVEQTKKLMEVIVATPSVVPRNCAVTVLPEFFALRTAGDEGLLDQAQRLSSFIEFHRSQLLERGLPQSISDFPAFFDGLIREAVPLTDVGLSYCPPLPDEVEISRYLFAKEDSEQGNEVDKLVALAPRDPTMFLEKAIALGFSLIPNCSNRSVLEQSIGLTMIVRALFDRLYEKDQLGPAADGGAELLARLGRLPIHVFNLPRYVSAPGKTAREYFSEQFLVGEPDLFLTWVSFFTNPVDILFVVHQSLSLIHRGALMAGLGRAELTPRELAIILGFDELFAFLIGVVLASDVPEFFRICEFIGRFTLRDSLSLAFEYANAAMSALLIYFRGVRIEEMEEEARQPVGQAG